jgi:arsenite methyltransferase
MAKLDRTKIFATPNYRLGQCMRFPILILALIVLPGAAAAPDPSRDPHQMHRLHQDSQAYIRLLEDPQRDSYQKPHEVLTALKFKPGEVVADIGAGSGYFTFRLAHHVGAAGKVYAVDVNSEMIRHINRHMRSHAVRNVVSVLADPDDPLLPEKSVDRVFICNVWHHIENPIGYIDRLKNSLKRGGEVVMIDFHKKDLPVGPPVQMKIAREVLIEQMQKSGFRLAREHTFLPYQYFLVFVPSG